MKNLWKKLVAGIFVFALVFAGMNLLSVEQNRVIAAEATEESAKYYVQQYTGTKVSEYKDANTTPAPTPAEGKEQYNDWIFAGWFTNEACTVALGEIISEEGTYYAKYVPAEVLSVKAQVKVDTTAESEKTDIRLVATVDSLNYKSVGFEVYYNGSTSPVKIKSTTVYSRIEAAKDGVEYGFSPNIFDTQSEYFITATLKNVANKNFSKSFYIRPYWETLDGTITYGVSRYARVEDSYLNIVNVPVRVVSDATTATTGTISVAYPTGYFTYADTYGTASTPGYTNGNVFDSVTVDGTTTAGTVTITGTAAEAQKVNGEVVHLRLKVQDGVTLPKKNTFTVTSSDLTTGVVVANSIYNYFAISAAYNGTPDTSWYDENETEFVITTAEELYGLAQKVNTDGVTFSGKTVYLGSNISINSGTPAGADGESGTDDDWSGTIAPNNIWIAIGKFNGAVPFSGVFDGQEHTIKGMYAKGTKDTSTSAGNVRRVGLFSYIKDATVKNVKILDSYVYARYEGASIAGQAENSTISNVYSNARVYHYDYQGGGIVGVLSGGTIEQCWYAGDVSAANASAGYVGGLVGVSTSATNVLIQDCLVSGSVNEQFTLSDYVRASQVTNPSVFNETSTWTMFTINGKKLLTAGDSNYIGKEFVVNNYSEDYLTVDIFTALHHGENINREQFYGNDTFSEKMIVKGAVLYAYPTHWDDSSKTSIAKRVNNFMELQRQNGMTGLVTTYESGSSGSKNPEDYFYHGQGTVVLTFGDSITAKVKAHNDWVNEYAPATTTTEE